MVNIPWMLHSTDFFLLIWFRILAPETMLPTFCYQPPTYSFPWETPRSSNIPSILESPLQLGLLLHSLTERSVRASLKAPWPCYTCLTWASFWSLGAILHNTYTIVHFTPVKEYHVNKAANSAASSKGSLTPSATPTVCSRDTSHWHSQLKFFLRPNENLRIYQVKFSVSSPLKPPFLLSQDKEWGQSVWQLHVPLYFPYSKLKRKKSKFSVLWVLQAYICEHVPWHKCGGQRTILWTDILP